MAIRAALTDLAVVAWSQPGRDPAMELANPNKSRDVTEFPHAGKTLHRNSAHDSEVRILLVTQLIQSHRPLNSRIRNMPVIAR